MPMLAVWVIAGLVLVVVVLVLVQLRKERERTLALERAARDAGFDFQPRADLAQILSLGDLPLYSHGHSRRARNVMTGRLGDDRVMLLDYQYTTGSGKHQHTTSQTVVVFPRAAPSLPDLQLAPENAFHRIGQLFGYQDIDFDSSPEFSRQYLVRGADETAIRAAFYADTLAFLAAHQGWTVEVRAGTAGIYRAGQRPPAPDLRSFLDEAHDVLRHLRRE